MSAQTGGRWLRLQTGDRERIEFALRATFSPADAPRRRCRIPLTIGDQLLMATVGQGGLDIDLSGGGDVDVEVTGSAKAMVQLLAEPERASTLVSDGDLAITGDDAVAVDALASFRIDHADS